MIFNLPLVLTNHMMDLTGNLNGENICLWRRSFQVLSSNLKGTLLTLFCNGITIDIQNCKVTQIGWIYFLKQHHFWYLIRKYKCNASTDGKTHYENQITTLNVSIWFPGPRPNFIPINLSSSINQCKTLAIVAELHVHTHARTIRTI